jgi:hypothetical protein
MPRKKGRIAGFPNHPLAAGFDVYETHRRMPQSACKRSLSAGRPYGYGAGRFGANRTQRRAALQDGDIENATILREANMG